MEVVGEGLLPDSARGRWDKPDDREHWAKVRRLRGVTGVQDDTVGSDDEPVDGNERDPEGSEVEPEGCGAAGCRVDSALSGANKRGV